MMRILLFDKHLRINFNLTKTETLTLEFSQ